MDYNGCVLLFFLPFLWIYRAIYRTDRAALEHAKIEKVMVDDAVLQYTLKTQILKSDSIQSFMGIRQVRLAGITNS